jgi:hypothetical protein
MEHWSLGRKLTTLQRGAHQSMKQHVDFLSGEFVGTIHKGQWVLLPTHLMMSDPHFHLSPLGVAPQLGHRPQNTFGYYFLCVNDDAVEMATAESIQFDRALLRILQALARSDPCLCWESNPGPQ